MTEYLIVIVLLVFSALFSGLTLGLMGLNGPELKRKMSLGDKNAAKVYEVRQNGNLLLTTLLIGNVAINSALAIFLGSIASGLIAGVVSTGLIVIFGEIIPQAVFSRYALSLGAKMTWLVKIFIFLFYPISSPITWALNKTLGDELASIYSRKELMEIVEEHRAAADSDVDFEEAQIIKGALTFSEKRAHDIMTPRTVVFSLPSDTIVDDDLLVDLAKRGYARIPVYEDTVDHIVGIVYLNDLIGSSKLGMTIGKLSDKKVLYAYEEEKLDDLFNSFIKTRNHIRVVKDMFEGVSGVITLEDVLEEIIQTEIMDETDEHEDLRAHATKIKKK